MKVWRSVVVMCLLLLGFLALHAPASDRTWTGGGDGRDWFDKNNWSPSDSYPLAGENVSISSGASILLSNSTAVLGDFSITNAMLAFTNWTTALQASNVTVRNNGLLTVPSAFTNNQMSNRVYIICTNFTLDSGGKIDVISKGYGPSNGLSFHFGTGDGPGAGGGDGGGYGSGAGNGGRGGCSQNNGVAGGIVNGLVTAPASPGSGGGSYSGGTWGKGGAGGGAVWIEARSTATVNGTILANGTNGSSLAGSGSGGSVYLSCWTLAGSSGQIKANGANAGSSSGGGGGGRIAVVYTNVATDTRISFSTSPGTGWGDVQTNRLWFTYAAGMGTLYLSDASLLTSPLDARFTDVRVIIPNFTSWSFNNLTVSNAVLAIENTNTAFRLTVTNDLIIRDGAELTLCGAPIKKGVISFAGAVNAGITNPAVTVGANLTLNGGTLVLGGGPPGLAGPLQQSKTELDVGGSLLATNGGRLYVYGGLTNATQAHGARVSVTNAVIIAPSSWIVPISQPTNGGSAVFRIGSLSVAAAGGVSADGRGYCAKYGQGKGSQPNYGGGGGYGGAGGRGTDLTAYGGNPYGVSNAPAAPGSGGGGYSGDFYRGFGGGCIWIESSGAVNLNGVLTAAGENSGSYGGGSGGGIFVTCTDLTGSGGSMSAAGGVSTGGGGGGGGRISVAIGFSESERNQLLAGQEVAGASHVSQISGYTGQIAATNGTGYSNGIPGTAFFLTKSASLTIAGSPAAYGSPSPRGYGTHTDIPANSWVTNSVASPADEASGTRRACVGWVLTSSGTPVANGSGTQAVFQLTISSTLTWYWTNEYYLSVGSDVNGTASVEKTGWYTNGTVVTVSATPSDGYAFNQWSGDAPVDLKTNASMNLTMNQPRTVTATFSSMTGQEKLWTGVGSWQSGANWSPAGVPGLLDSAMIGAGTVTLSTAESVGSLIVSNGATLVFTNWTAKLTASGDVTIRSNALVTLPAAFTNNQMSNCVHFVCSNFTLLAGGRIDVTGKGFGPSNGPAFHYGVGDGPGGGTYDAGNGYGGGAGYGGRGGTASGAAGSSPYGTTALPTAPGSSGGSYLPGTWGRGGAGGGAVWIESAETTTVSGAIMANGTNGTGVAGGGSGGGVTISCRTFAGSGGAISANGGNGGESTTWGGGGGGGRIAIVCTNVVPDTWVSFATSPGTGWGEQQTNRLWWKYVAGMGTLYLSDRSLLSMTLDRFTDVRVVIPDFTAWNVDHLTVSNSVLALGDTNTAFRLTVTNDLVVRSGGELTLCGLPLKKGSVSIGGATGAGTTNPIISVGGNLTLDGGTIILGGGPREVAGQTQQSKPELSVLGNMILTNASQLHVYAGVTNAPGADGAAVLITGNVSIAASSWIHPACNPGNGGGVAFGMSNLSVAAGGGFNADGRGYSPGYGSGKGMNGTGAGYSSGAGYGGKGGDGSDANTYGGSAYGSSNAPVDPGSGCAPYAIGSSLSRGFGGGSIRIVAQDSVALNGLLTANGEDDVSVWGGGSGGGIFVTCETFGGLGTGALRVTGGNGKSGFPGSGGGGGGRIAVWYGVPNSRRAGILDGSDLRRVVIDTTNKTFLGTATAGYGTGWSNGSPGTVVFLTISRQKGTIFSIR